MLGKLLLKAAANIGALFTSVNYIPAFEIVPRAIVSPELIAFGPQAQWFIAGGISLAIVNGALRPLLKALGALLPLVTFVLLSVLLNAAMLFAADLALSEVTLGLRGLALGALLLGVLNAIL